MTKEAKTNAMRILDRRKEAYRAIRYECTAFTDGVESAVRAGTDLERTFKTLVTRARSGSFYVFVIPIACELDLKKAARLAGEKSLDMLPVKDLQGVTGYVRGGCSPIGMKKQFLTYIDSSAGQYDEIYVSGGRLGLSLALSPAGLASVCSADFGELTEK